MTTAKHTPGPWRISANQTNVYVPGYAIAACQSDDDLEFRPRSEAIENARLIAAAPDLVAALRGIVETCEANMLHSDTIRKNADRPRGPEGEAMYQRVKASTDLARAALAKVEG